MPLRTTFALLALLVAAMPIAGTAAAQPFGTDILATTTGGGILYRIHPNGTWNTVTGFTSLPNMVCMDQNNQDILVVTYQPASIVVVDSSVGRVVRTLWGGKPLYRADWFAPLHDGSFVVAGTMLTLPNLTGALIRVQPNGGHTTIYAGAPLRIPQGMVQDLTNGHLALCGLGTATLFDVTLSGTFTTLWQPSNPLMRFFSITQDHFDGSLIIGPGGISSWIGVARYDRATGKATSLVGPKVVNNSNAICFDRGAGTGEVIVGSGPVHRISRAGTMMLTINNLPWNNTGMCFDRGRNIVTLRTGSPNKWAIQLDFPNRTGYGYLIGLSASGFTPGIPVDSRVIPLVPDDLLRLSLNGSLANYLKGGAGALGFGGRATATLDLSSFGNQLTGIPIWIAAVTFDFRAPSGIDIISKPVILPLD